MRCLRGALVVLAFAIAAPAAEAAKDRTDSWLPAADGAAWVYAWSNSAYSPQPRKEHISVESRSGSLFRLKWQEIEVAAEDRPAQGVMDFRQTAAGLVNVNYQSSQPPPQFPVLCASATECGNSLAGTLFALIWGTRSPVLAEPLLRGTRWNATGGAANDVASANRYVGRRKIKVPAFPNGVHVAEVESEITQGGALGDPFGSGVRTVFWARGVGPVRIVMRHSGGEVTRSELLSTTLEAKRLPSDANLFPLERGKRAEFRWRNNKHMKRWSRQRFEVAEVVNGAARVDVKSLSGPIRIAGSYTFASRAAGVSHLQGFTRAATRVRFPGLGPRRLPRDKRRRLLTPYDFMVFGFGPVIPTSGKIGTTWRSSRDSADYRYFGVTGKSRVVGVQRVRTRMGRYRAKVVRSTLRQRGYRYGSGTRTMWLAPNKGLVKLVFKHADGSVTRVERLK